MLTPLKMKIMKTIETRKIFRIIFLLALIAGVVSSCKKDDPEPEEEDPLEGLIVVHFNTDGGTEIPYVIIEEEGLFTGGNQRYLFAIFSSDRSGIPLEFVQRLESFWDV